MSHTFNLEEYLSNGVENIIKGALKASLSNPKESLFISKYMLASNNASKLRKDFEAQGEHIPPFLIASITSYCNLYCKGCYARANNSCSDHNTDSLLSSSEWDKIFMEAEKLGISFILLAGGEPLLRNDVIEVASHYKNIIFPIFTNGTLINDIYIKHFDKYRNLIPVISIEGNQQYTDSRRGNGVYEKLIKVMDDLKERKILYGASITVTKVNLNEVTDQTFLTELSKRGCKVVFYIEYVPVNKDTKELAPTDTEREELANRLHKLRTSNQDMVFISFPGDEKSSGGCLAAGRGFFHINAHGGAEPCPFSPYSDTNLRDTSLREALHSPLFQRLCNQNILMKEHDGGCTLFEQEEVVKSLLD
ncbi:radical SAM protein [Anaeromicropila herbilytica]|uniref:Radical SAM protein n=1 Tax=Anaeromicropila herbilytica TaxID=2785025 RepID=A0A7R7EIT0_9FIRM|nr:radical SAM protein [Anaeromicropila herbilytica]BCN29480.1 radical SAM protein [Anaeromicropila herbilytica]